MNFAFLSLREQSVPVWAGWRHGALGPSMHAGRRSLPFPELCRLIFPVNARLSFLGVCAFWRIHKARPAAVGLIPRYNRLLAELRLKSGNSLSLFLVESDRIAQCPVLATAWVVPAVRHGHRNRAA